MRGTTIEELREKVFKGHEVEFFYNNCEYSMELDIIDNLKVIKIWEYKGAKSTCISSVVVYCVEDMENVFNERCFNGKNFFEIESQVNVEIIF